MKPARRQHSQTTSHAQSLNMVVWKISNPELEADPDPEPDPKPKF